LGSAGAGGPLCRSVRCSNGKKSRQTQGYERDLENISLHVYLVEDFLECAERYSHSASPPVGHEARKWLRLRSKVLLESVTLYVGTGGVIGSGKAGIRKFTAVREK